MDKTNNINYNLICTVCFAGRAIENSVTRIIKTPLEKSII